MIKEILLKQMIKRQLKGSMSDQQIDQLVSVISKNPDVFEKLAKSLQNKLSSGKSQIDAAKELAGEEAELLKKVFGEISK